MTCIVGIKIEDEVWMGGDALSTFGDFAAPLKAPKVFRLADGRMLMGVAGSTRVLSLLSQDFEVPEHPEGVDALAYLSGPFGRRLRSYLIENGAWKSDEEEMPDSTHLLAAYQQRLFYLTSTLSVYEPLRGYDATGSGCEVAMGSLHATAKAGFDPAICIQWALEAASEMKTNVAPPFHIEKL